MRTITIRGWADVGDVDVPADRLPEVLHGYGVAYYVAEDPGRYCFRCAARRARYGCVIHAANYARRCACCGYDLRQNATRV